MQGYRFPNIIISIHALRGEGDVEQLGFSGVVTDISIHALRGEGDEQGEEGSTPPMISIHALRGEGDEVKRAG